MRSITGIALLTTVAALAGCEGENLFRTGGVTLVEQPDVFEAIVFEIEDPDTDSIIDILDEGGRFQLELDDEDGTFDSDFRFNGVTANVTGTFSSDGDEFTFSDDPFLNDNIVVARTLEFNRTGDIIVLRDPTAAWDVDNDGTAEVVELEVQLELQ